MKFDFKVTATANKPASGSKPAFTGFLVENENNIKDKWYKCTLDVKDYIDRFKPCIITIDEQIDDTVKRVILVKSLKPHNAPLNVPNDAAKSPIRNDGPNKCTSGGPFSSKGAKNNLYEEILSHAEDSIINALDFWEKKKPNKLTKDAIAALEQKKEFLYKLIDNLNNA